jgi:hypothetical protein
MDQRSKCKTSKFETTRRKQGKYFKDVGKDISLDMTPKTQATKAEIGK